MPRHITPITGKTPDSHEGRSLSVKKHPIFDRVSAEFVEMVIFRTIGGPIRQSLFSRAVEGASHLTRHLIAGPDSGLKALKKLGQKNPKEP